MPVGLRQRRGDHDGRNRQRGRLRAIADSATRQRDGRLIRVTGDVGVRHTIARVAPG